MFSPDTYNALGDNNSDSSDLSRYDSVVLKSPLRKSEPVKCDFIQYSEESE